MVDTRKLWRRLKIREESGQSLVEFALVLIFIILPLIMVFIEASVTLYKYVALTNAAREGAGRVYLPLCRRSGRFIGRARRRAQCSNCFDRGRRCGTHYAGAT